MNLKELEEKLLKLHAIARETEQASALMSGHLSLWKAAVMSGDGKSETEHRNAMIEAFGVKLDIIAKAIQFEKE
jgi:hypothetical protein